MLGPLSNTIQGVVSFTWPMVTISMIILVSFMLLGIYGSSKNMLITSRISTIIITPTLLLTILSFMPQIVLADDIDIIGDIFLSDIIREDDMI